MKINEINNLIQKNKILKILSHNGANCDISFTYRGLEVISAAYSVNIERLTYDIYSGEHLGLAGLTVNLIERHSAPCNIGCLELRLPVDGHVKMLEITKKLFAVLLGGIRRDKVCNTRTLTNGA